MAALRGRLFFRVEDYSLIFEAGLHIIADFDGFIIIGASALLNHRCITLSYMDSNSSIKQSRCLIK
jgi:hypothetical protein